MFPFLLSLEKSHLLCENEAKASRKLVKRAPHTLVEKFITPGSKQICYNVCGRIKVVNSHSVQPFLEVLSFVSLLVHFGWEPYLCISEDVYEEDVRLFYSNLYCPAVLEGEELIIRSYSFECPYRAF